MVDLLKTLNPTLLVLLTCVLFFTVNLLVGVVLYFAKRHIKSVDSRFTSTNRAIETQTESISDLVFEIQTTKKDINDGFNKVHRALGIATVESARHETQLSQVMEECKRLDNRLERSESKLEKQSESIHYNSERIISILGKIPTKG